ncbi:AMP-binding enzyme [Lactiplantibacillus plantarum]|uniref:AMP-binding enzyme n=1 Tax=Lactiplantibacillus plantarum TaxID=1590 RepID=UPI0040455D74
MPVRRYIEIKDRAKDIIISGGENISTVEIESVLYRHPDVLEAAVVARPDAVWGETPCAFVTLKEGASRSADELIAYCREHLARFKTPRTVVFGALPKTVERQRVTQRRARARGGALSVSLVGYTNAGKSTLFNALTRADTYAADQLFATLDTTTRRIWIEGAGNVVVSDTVGFIRDLPHDLIAAFRATLEEALDFNSARAAQPLDRLLNERVIRADDVAAYFHTGGTTGAPKLAIHTHANQVFTAWAAVQLQGAGPGDVVINGYPLFHVAGVLPASLAALSAGVHWSGWRTRWASARRCWSATTGARRSPGRRRSCGRTGSGPWRRSACR